MTTLVSTECIVNLFLLHLSSRLRSEIVLLRCRFHSVVDSDCVVSVKKHDNESNMTYIGFPLSLTLLIFKASLKYSASSVVTLVYGLRISVRVCQESGFLR